MEIRRALARILDGASRFQSAFKSNHYEFASSTNVCFFDPFFGFNSLVDVAESVMPHQHCDVELLVEPGTDLLLCSGAKGKSSHLLTTECINAVGFGDVIRDDVPGGAHFTHRFEVAGLVGKLDMWSRKSLAGLAARMHEYLG